MAKKDYTEREATDDAKRILENIMCRQNYCFEVVENLSAVLQQIVIRELKK